MMANMGTLCEYSANTSATKENYNGGVHIILFYRSHIASCTPIGFIEHQKRRRVINLFVSLVAFRLRTTLVCIRICLMARNVFN